MRVLSTRPCGLSAGCRSNTRLHVSIRDLKKPLVHFPSHESLRAGQVQQNFRPPSAVPDDMISDHDHDDAHDRSTSDNSRMKRWQQRIDGGDSSSSSGIAGPDIVAVFFEGVGPATTRMKQQHTRLTEGQHDHDDQMMMETASNSSGSSSGGGRDLSDMLNESTGASSSSSSSSGTTDDDIIDPESARIHAEETPSLNPRVHPIARTAGAAAASAAGTILGAAAGPVGAAAGAALGAAVGRRAADLLAGSDKQAEVYDAGAEPEQVAEELLSVGDQVTDRAQQAAHTVQSKASDLVDRATEKLHNDSGGSAAAAQTVAYTDMGAVNTFDIGMEDQPTISASDLLRSASGSGSDHHHSRSKVADLAKSAADCVAGAAESLKDSAVDVAETAADKIKDLANDLPLPEFPPSTTAAAGGDEHDDQDPHAAGGGVRLEDDPTVQAVRDRVSGAAERIEAAVADATDQARAAAAAASERLSGAGDRAAAAADRTTHTAADYGSGVSGHNRPSAVGDIPESDWASSQDLGAMPAAAADMNTPAAASDSPSLFQQDNMSLTDQLA